MPRSYRIFADAHYAYFVTCTVVDWLAVFADDVYCQIILNSLAYLREHKRTQLNAFVVMSTHLHGVLWPEEGVDLSDVLRDFKRFTSRAISREAARRDDRHFLAGFAAARQRGRAQEVSQFQVWQEGSHPEAIYTVDFARQKIDYIHANPVRAGLVSGAEEWLYSSARAYLRGEETFPPTDLLPL
ncbi:MAG: transposase [Chloroflexota bacterium]